MLSAYDKHQRWQLRLVETLFECTRLALVAACKNKLQTFALSLLKQVYIKKKEMLSTSLSLCIPDSYLQIFMTVILKDFSS